MNKIQRKLVSVAATAALMLNTLTPAFAATTIEISGNGAGADNLTQVNQTTTTAVTQTNTANVTNTVNADAKTGGNDANYNTGGDVMVVTGNAKVASSIENTLNSNSANVDCCVTGNTNVAITGNGAKTDNAVDLIQTTVTVVGQTNTANVTNYVNADAKTGGNDGNKNTGGDVVIATGNAMVDSYISTTANMNVAKVGSALGASNPSASFVISGNGAGSDNYISAALAKVTSVGQTNTANVTNIVDADAKTGGNDANFNTGGDVIVSTGHALVKAGIDNAVNFNFADIDCGCTWDVLAKIAGNGADTDHRHRHKPDNYIGLTLGSTQSVGQGNLSNLNNVLNDLGAYTGYNESEMNTGDVDGISDPAIITGNAIVETYVGNSGNVNTVGGFMPFSMPQMPQFEMSFNMMALWAMLGWNA